MSNPLADMDKPNVIFCIGTNMTECHPVAATRLKKAIARGAKMIVADPRRIELATMADLYLQLRPGSNVALYNGLAHVIVRDGLYAKDFVDGRVDGFAAYAEFIGKYDPKHVEEITGVPAKLVEQAAHLYATSKPASISYGLGVTEQSWTHSRGRDPNTPIDPGTHTSTHPAPVRHLGTSEPDRCTHRP
jgi:anaerobic selenocysteine-containing dehydrogenase